MDIGAPVPAALRRATRATATAPRATVALGANCVPGRRTWSNVWKVRRGASRCSCGWSARPRRCGRVAFGGDAVQGKALVGFCQCISAVPSVFHVVPPVGLEEYTRWIDLLELPADLENIFISSACFGEYRKRHPVVLVSSSPVVLTLVFAAELLHGSCPPSPSSSCQARQQGSSRPSESIEYGNGQTRRYLVADLALSCDAK
eukprot:5099410-Prymnesium_polylepis.1